jgi:hypothetical protein
MLRHTLAVALTASLLVLTGACSGKPKPTSAPSTPNPGGDPPKDKTQDKSDKTGRTSGKNRALGPDIRASVDRIKRTNDLKNIGLAYQNCLIQTGKAPAKAEDLAPFFDNDQKLVKALKDNEIIFVYGVSQNQMPKGTANTILAYEGQCPKQGGMVLMGDGTVRQMTAAEFDDTALAGEQ